VSDNGGVGPILFDGSVAVGEAFGLSNNGTEFGDTQLITISTLDQTAVLQVVEGVSLTCSHPLLEFGNRYGACQVIEYMNEEQGLISSFVASSFALEIRILLSVHLADRHSGQRYTLTSVTGETNFAGTVDLTEQFVGEEVNAENDAEVTLEGTIDMSFRRTFVIEVYVEALASPGNKRCSWTAKYDSSVMH